MSIRRDTSAAMPVRNGHTGYLEWQIAGGVTFTVLCKTCPGHRSGEDLVVDMWQARSDAPSDRPDMSWKRHTRIAPPKPLPTMAQLLTAGGAP